MLPDVAFLFGKIAGQSHIENQIGMTCAPNHAEIVGGKAAVVGFQNCIHQGVQSRQLRVISDHRIIVDHQLDTMAAEALPFHVVDEFMAQQWVKKRMPLKQMCLKC